MISCSFNTKTARDEVRRLIGINEPSVLSGLDKDQNRKCRMKDGDRSGFLRELNAQMACRRYFEHGHTAEALLRMECMTRIMGT